MHTLLLIMCKAVDPLIQVMKSFSVAGFVKKMLKAVVVITKSKTHFVLSPFSFVTLKAPLIYQYTI